MNVRTFTNEVPQWLGAALEDFEREFTYPLGENTRFRISHGRDYLRFFRAMGEAACVVAEKDGKVLGTLCGAVQILTMPGGATKKALYVGDLKITAGARGTRVLISLARALEAWAQGRAQAAYSVVMDGTEITPASYSGRAGLPVFAPVMQVSILRVPARKGEARAEDAGSPLEPIDSFALRVVDKLRASGTIVHIGGEPLLRSRLEPRWLTGAEAFGRLEDTALAKKLVMLDGSEIAAAHLAMFRYERAGGAARLLSAVARLIAVEGIPCFFTAVGAKDMDRIVYQLREIDPAAAAGTTAAGATVFATGLPSGVPWLVNTSEI